MTGGVLDADESSIVSGALSHTADITIDVADNKTLTYSGGNLNVGAHTLSIGGAGTLSNATGSPLVLDVADSILSLTGNGTISGPVKLESGTLKSTGLPTVSGAMTQSGDTTIDVLANKTLTYSGASFSLGANTLTLTGGGTLVSGGLDLNNANSKLLLNSITVDSVSTTVDSLGLDVDADSTVTSLSVANITPVSIASGKTLSGAITVTAGSINLDETGSLASTVEMSGGVLDADETLTVSGALTQSGDTTIDVLANKTLSYSGTALSLGANTLTMSGGGTFYNSDNLTLSAESKLKLDGIGKVEKVYVSENLTNGFIEVNENTIIQTFLQTKSSRIDIADGKSLTLTDTFEVPVDQTMEFYGLGNGTINIGDNLTLSGILKLNAQNNTLANGKLVFNNGVLDVDKDTTISTEIFLADNASMDLANGIQLGVTNTFEVPQGLKLEMIGTGGGTLSLTELKLTGILQFSALDYILRNGTLELNDGSLLDVDYNTIIYSNVVLSGNTTIDVAQHVSLQYVGNAIDLLNYQLTFLGNGEFLNTNALLLSDSGSLLILAGDITITLIEVYVCTNDGCKGNSTAEKGIRVESAYASITDLNLLADMGLTFTDDAYALNVLNLNVKAKAQLTGDGNGGWLKVQVLTQDTATDVLTMHDINVSVVVAINIDNDGQLVMTGNTDFIAIGGLTFNVDGAMNFAGTVTANINLNGGTMCLTDNTTIIGNITTFC